jgi:hypothetical protein
MKGLSIHFPINIEMNLELIKNKTMPSIDNFLILVKNYSNNTRKIWYDIVDLKKVICALEYLKLTNIYYKDIIIDYKILNRDLDLNNIIELVEPDNNISENNFELETYFGENSIPNIQYDRKIEIKINKNFSLDSIGKNNPKINDIDMYSTTKINQLPFRDNYEHLDHLCFPSIFCKGKIE